MFGGGSCFHSMLGSSIASGLLGTTRSLDAFAKSSGIGRIFGREETRGVAWASMDLTHCFHMFPLFPRFRVDTMQQKITFPWFEEMKVLQNEIIGLKKSPVSTSSKDLKVLQVQGIENGCTEVSRCWSLPTWWVPKGYLDALLMTETFGLCGFYRIL